VTRPTPLPWTQPSQHAVHVPHARFPATLTAITLSVVAAALVSLVAAPALALAADRMSAGTEQRLRSGGALCDVAPTILSMLGVEQPAEMTGVNLGVD